VVISSFCCSSASFKVRHNDNAGRVVRDLASRNRRGISPSGTSFTQLIPARTQWKSTASRTRRGSTSTNRLSSASQARTSGSPRTPSSRASDRRCTSCSSTAGASSPDPCPSSALPLITIALADATPRLRRAERKKDQVCSPGEYRRVFERANALPPGVAHVIVQVGIPIAYPRMVFLETALESKFNPLVALGRHGTMGLSGFVNKFNAEAELLDDLVRGFMRCAAGC
jgi:hypothetical protein